MKQWIWIAILLPGMAFAGWEEPEDDSGVDVNVTTEETQEQDQEQSQSQTATQGNQQNLQLSSQSPARVFTGGGDSSAADQKVFSIGGGWLTGGAALRFDLTDRDGRKWRWAEEFQADGQYQASVMMRCSIKKVWREVGGSEEGCIGILTRPPETNDDLLQELMRQMEMLRDQVEYTDTKCDRQFEACVTK